MPISRNHHRPAQALPGPISGEKPEELAWAGGPIFSASPMERWNPDDLVGHQGYAVYRKILKDDQVRALLALKQAMITSRKWHFRPMENNRRQRDCAEFFRFLLEKNLRGPFKQALSNLMSSQAFGFSLLEKVYEPVRWKERTLWGICQLKLRPAETFTFEMDAHGNMTGLLQEQGGRKTSLPPWRFIHHINKPEVHPLYGESDLREVHRHWWSKENICKAWISFNGMGTIAIRDSFNVASIADNGTGDYTVTWDTDFASAEYSVVPTSTQGDAPTFSTQTVIDTRSSGSCGVYCRDSGNSPEDMEYVDVHAYGAQ